MHRDKLGPVSMVTGPAGLPEKSGLPSGPEPDVCVECLHGDGAQPLRLPSPKQQVLHCPATGGYGGGCGWGSPGSAHDHTPGPAVDREWHRSPSFWHQCLRLVLCDITSCCLWQVPNFLLSQVRQVNQVSNQRQLDLQRTKRWLLKKKNDRNQVRTKPGPEQTRELVRRGLGQVENQVKPGSGGTCHTSVSVCRSLTCVTVLSGFMHPCTQRFPWRYNLTARWEPETLLPTSTVRTGNVGRSQDMCGHIALPDFTWT